MQMTQTIHAIILNGNQKQGYMEFIDFYSKKKELHIEMIDAICNILDKHNVSELSLDEDCGAYVCLAFSGPAFEVKVKKIRHVVGTYILEWQPYSTDSYEFGDEWYDMIDDVLYTSIQYVYEAIYKLYEK